MCVKVLVASSLEEAMTTLSANEMVAQIFVLGGGSVYKEAIESKVSLCHFLDKWNKCV